MGTHACPLQLLDDEVHPSRRFVRCHQLTCVQFGCGIAQLVVRRKVSSHWTLLEPWFAHPGGKVCAGDKRGTIFHKLAETMVQK